MSKIQQENNFQVEEVLNKFPEDCSIIKTSTLRILLAKIKDENFFETSKDETFIHSAVEEVEKEIFRSEARRLIVQFERL